MGCSSTNTVNGFSKFNKIFKKNQSNEIVTSSILKNNYRKKKIEYPNFTSSNLRKNVIVAVKNNPLVEAGLLEIDSSKSSEKVVEAQNKPQVNFQASAGATRADAENSIGALGTLSVSKILYDSGVINNNIMSQKFRTKAAIEELNNIAQNLALSGYLAINELARTQKIKRVYDRGLEMGGSLIKQIDNISSSGISDKTMILKAQKEFSEIVVQSIQAKVAKKSAEINFKDFFQTTSIPNLETLRPLEVDKLEKLSRKLVNYNPSIKVQNLIIESAKSNLKASQNQKNPNVSLRAGINTPAEDILDNTSANFGFVVNYIYDDGGRLDSQIEGINSQIEAGIKRRDDLIKGLNKQLDLSYQSYLNAIEAKKELEKLIKLLNETLETSKAQLVTGRAKIQDVLNNELDLAKKEIDLISVNSTLVSSSYNIKYLTSGIIPKITK